jgi:N-methylhydantoinase A
MHSPQKTKQPRPSRLRIGVDVGGTFTDLVVVMEDGRSEVFKVPSVPSDPSVGVIEAVKAAAAGLGFGVAELLAPCDAFVHGSTIATNTVLERKGARVGMLATAGFRDSIAIRRGLRTNPWDHRTPFVEPLVPRHLRLGVRGRIDVEGHELEALEETDIEAALATFAVHGAQAIAICFINAYVDPRHEQQAERAIRRLGCDLPVSLSSALAPIMGEYERGSTTVIDAHIRARVVSYLKALEERLHALGLRQDILIVQSNGGAVSVDRVARAPVGICLSGPAAGVGAMRYFGKMCGTQDLITMEIGGTSCDVTMMSGGRAQLVDLYELGGFHVAQPAIEIHTVGAGGGTIARVDDAGLLICGPQGAGAEPGPAAYGRGGLDPTTTDALVILGRMRPGPIGDGAIEIDEARARAAVGEKVASRLGVSVEEAAAGMISLLEQNLLHAVEEISVKRGVDPARYTLVAAGGAGPMHGAAVGRMLGCKRVYVPRHAGVFCALGMLDSDLRLDFMRVADVELSSSGVAGLDPALAVVQADAADEISREGHDAGVVAYEAELDLTYKGQLRSLRIPFSRGVDDAAVIKARFEAEHRRTYGHIKPITPIRIVGLRLIATIPAIRLASPRPAAAEGPPCPSGSRRVYVDRVAGWLDVPIYEGTLLRPGHRIDGPLVVQETTTTIFAGRGDVVNVDASGNYLIEIG